MHPRRVFSSVMLAVTALATPLCAEGDSSLILTHALTAKVSVGKPVGPAPVDGTGNVVCVEPITHGSIAGVINGTILGGSATLSLSDNATVANPLVEIWGQTDDEPPVPFVVRASGIGVPGKQIARVMLDIGEQYAHLRDVFIIATFTDNNKEPPTASNIEGWIVSRG